jgi:hypothetical protein
MPSLPSLLAGNFSARSGGRNSKGYGGSVSTAPLQPEGRRRVVGGEGEPLTLGEAFSQHFGGGTVGQTELDRDRMKAASRDFNMYLHDDPYGRQFEATTVVGTRPDVQDPGRRPGCLEAESWWEPSGGAK